MKRNKQDLALFLGFSLLESLTALFILCVILLLLQQGIMNVSQTCSWFTNRQDTAWHLFLIQWEETVKEGKIYHVSPRRIIYEMPFNEMIILEYYAPGQLLRKTSPQGGHEVVLFEVSSAQFKVVDEGVVLIEVQDKHRKTYQAFFKTLPL